jgi:DNA polymerase III delta prime subunit
MAYEAVPFIGRKTLLHRLGILYRSSRHVLLLGPPGVGKSLVIAELLRTHPVLFAQDCGCLGDLLASLEPAAGLDPGELKMPARVHRLAARLPELVRPIVIDNVARVPPFSLAETQAFLAAVDFAGDRRELLAAALRLHRLAAGHPATLAALVTELRCRTYDLRTSEGLRLLALHARITFVEEKLAAG